MIGGRELKHPGQITFAEYLLEPNKFVRHYRAEMFGANMKTRCEYCGGPFGLIRRRYFDHQFCCEACETAYKEQRAKIATQLKSSSYPSLSENR
jgi:hypothetical protein